MNFTIRVPGSTSNLGPGFDVLGMTLDIYLTVHVSVSGNSDGVKITYTNNSVEADEQCDVSLHPHCNLITKTAMTVAKMYKTELPEHMTIDIVNEIPLCRGLGSSGAAVIAGVLIANKLCHLGLDAKTIIKLCTQFEGHPDNVTASFIGGLVVSGGDGDYVRIPINNTIKAVVVVPKFKLSTEISRQVLPNEYKRQHVVFNLQRLALLITSLSQSVINPKLVNKAMADQLHQPYRQYLVPGLSDIVSLGPDTIHGLLGVCLSGAGPTVTALCTCSTDVIGKRISEIFSDNDIESNVTVLQIVNEGARLEEQKIE